MQNLPATPPTLALSGLGIVAQDTRTKTPKNNSTRQGSIFLKIISPPYLWINKIKLSYTLKSSIRQY
jgi:hypothetical protein